MPRSPNPSAEPEKTWLAKVAAASSIGTTIEYRLLLRRRLHRGVDGTTAALVLPTLVFPGRYAAATL